MSLKNLEIVSTGNVSLENDVFNLVVEAKNIKIGAIRAEIGTKAREQARLDILRTIFSELSRLLPNGELWWLVGDNFWQVENRVSKLKNSRGCAEFSVSKPISKQHQSQDRVRYFQAEKVTESSFDAIAMNSSPVECSYLIFVPCGFDVGTLLESGWENKIEESQELLSGAVVEGFVCKSYGSFDDPETGWLILTNSSYAKQFGKHKF